MSGCADNGERVEQSGANTTEARAERRRRVPGGRTHRYNVRFTAQEYELVQAAADAAGLTAPHLIAETTLLSLQGRGQLPIVDRRVLLHELTLIRKFLGSVTRNVNQMAVTANSTGCLPTVTEMEATMRAVATIVRRINVVISPFDPNNCQD